jgi:hypothetical protein
VLFSDQASRASGAEKPARIANGPSARKLAEMATMRMPLRCDGVAARYVCDDSRVNQASMESLLSAELARIDDAPLHAELASTLVTPSCQMRDWDYGAEPTQYACWVVSRDDTADWCIVYCEQGFAESGSPWGILSTSDQRMGPDALWHVSLEHAFRASSRWSHRNPPGYEVP